jgi:hypothetical protein
MIRPVSRFRRWVGLLISGAGLAVLIGNFIEQVLR